MSKLYTPVFRDALPSDDHRDWWRLIRRLAGQLYDVELPDLGRAPAWWDDAGARRRIRANVNTILDRSRGVP